MKNKYLNILVSRYSVPLQGKPETRHPHYPAYGKRTEIMNIKGVVTEVGQVILKPKWHTLPELNPVSVA